MKWRHYLCLDGLCYEITDSELRPKIGETVDIPTCGDDTDLLDVTHVVHWSKERCTEYDLEWQEWLNKDELRLVGWTDAWKESESHE